MSESEKEEPSNEVVEELAEESGEENDEAQANDGAVPVETAGPTESVAITIDPTILEGIRVRQEQEKMHHDAMSDVFRKSLMEKLQTENDLYSSNRYKVLSLWRDKLRAAKRDELLANISELIADFENHISRKDSLIALSAHSVTVAESQLSRLQRAHLYTISTLLQNLENDVGLLETTLHDRLCELETQYQLEKTSLQAMYSVKKANLNQILEATIEQQNALTETVGHQYDEKLTTMTNVIQERTSVMRLGVEEINGRIEKHLVEAHEKYKIAVESKLQHFRNLLLKSRLGTQVILSQKQKLAALEQQVSFWKKKIQSTIQDFDQKNSKLKAEKQNVLSEFVELKTELKDYISKGEQKKRKLTLLAHDTQDNMMKIITREQKIVRIAMMCTNLETEAERVGLDDESEVLTKEEQQIMLENDAELRSLTQQIQTQLRTESEENQTEEQSGPENQSMSATAIVAKLRPIYKKLAKVEIDKLSLEKEGELLVQENLQLRAALQKFMNPNAPSDVGSLISYK